MKTALVVDSMTSPDLLIFEDLVDEARRTARRDGLAAKIYFQNNLKAETLAIMVQIGNRTFGGAGKTFHKAACITIKDLRKYNDELLASSEQAARKTHSKRRGR